MRMTAAMFCAVITLLIGRPESANAGACVCTTTHGRTIAGFRRLRSVALRHSRTPAHTARQIIANHLRLLALGKGCKLRVERAKAFRRRAKRRLAASTQAARRGPYTGGCSPSKGSPKSRAAPANTRRTGPRPSARSIARPPTAPTGVRRRTPRHLLAARSPTHFRPA